MSPGAHAEPAQQPVRLASIGMVPGNGHPYSWSAIVNGYDRRAMAACPYPVIVRYLDAQPPERIGLPAVQVTHIWTDDPSEAPQVATAARIPHILERPEAAIGEVDAILLATDDGERHVERARPFVEAGLPVFVDKPLALSLSDLRIFQEWVERGHRILSSSGLRYAPEFDPWIEDPLRDGPLQWMSGIASKSWERYGIHFLEPFSRLAGPGFTSVRLDSPRPGLEIAQISHCSGLEITIPVIADGGASFGRVMIAAANGCSAFSLEDTFTAFRRQLEQFVDYVRSGEAPYPFSHTLDLMFTVVAGIRSREAGGSRISIDALRQEFEDYGSKQ